ncbi:trigger factor [Granulicatella sp. zg-ZJ]|uniref:trigger factor n=1 Tax=unclassified Granulicatella TaxID=2630493 RepID=UPI0013C1DFE3|nr:MULTISPECIES: trigger factor [unclassified Granulicatella]MBS4749642.1 trigger factor [Carnobacteriaceae bacterium zg-ZUI78]NEW61771.1 trigger factor [Granulicatella sp. zg-ZJ]NEW66365.1 trigger factor [Granulicatella sp. zg-84]QMI86461.1 trigger factor [Carnobacteriaceae bacterium zg-84]
MTAKWEKTGTNNGVLTFEISQDKIKEGLDKAFKRVQPKLNVAGFRKGKVPRTIFNKQFGEEALYEDALNILLPDAYDNAIEELALFPVAQPKINVKSIEKGQDWVIEAEVVVKPEVKLGDYKGLTVEKQDRTVTVEDVENELAKKQEQFAELSVKEGKAENGDTVVIDFEGFKDGVAFAGGKGENHSLELGSNSFIPGFEDQLVGTSAGDDVEVNVTFPEEYHAEDLKGQPATFKVTVKEVKSKELPALDDEFAKDVDDSVETLAELKDKLQESLQKAKDEAAQTAVEDAALRQAVDNAEIVELPEEMVHAEVHRQMDFFLNNMKRQGISEELYYQLTGTTRADLHKQMEKDADVQVKTNLVLEKVAEVENLDATEDDMNKEIEELAATYGMEIDAVRNVLNAEMLTHDIKMKKAMAVIVDSAIEK